jgi:hypothetical protein
MNLKILLLLAVISSQAHAGWLFDTLEEKEEKRWNKMSELEKNDEVFKSYEKRKRAREAREQKIANQTSPAPVKATAKKLDIKSDPDSDGIPGRKGVEYEVYSISDYEENKIIIPKDLGEVSIEKGVLTVKKKDGSILTIDKYDFGFHDSAKKSDKKVTQQYFQPSNKFPNMRTILVWDHEINLEGFQNMTEIANADEEKRELNIKGCTKLVGQNIVCPEGNYKISKILKIYGPQPKPVDDIDNCEVKVGQVIICREGDYKFIGSRSLSEVDNSSRNNAKPIESKASEKKESASKAQTK